LRSSWKVGDRQAARKGEKESCRVFPWEKQRYGGCRATHSKKNGLLFQPVKKKKEPPSRSNGDLSKKTIPRGKITESWGGGIILPPTRPAALRGRGKGEGWGGIKRGGGTEEKRGEIL